MCNHITTLQVGWYWGPLSWDEAEAKLATKPDGSFIVRDSSDDRYILSLSFRSQQSTHHTRIEHYKGAYMCTSHKKWGLMVPCKWWRRIGIQNYVTAKRARVHGNMFYGNIMRGVI